MAWTETALKNLASQNTCGYSASHDAATEPTALAALAAAAYGLTETAVGFCEQLRAWQSDDGSLGVTPDQPTPRWPTSLAILAWRYVEQSTNQARFASCWHKAVQWTLADHGEAMPQQSYVGHDTSIVGWSWAADTHSWIEPTALFVAALKATGNDRHARTRQGVRLLVNRLLPQGGCNYGNTTVLGQPLLPHVQPTGVAMLALRGENANDIRIERSLNYLRRSLSETRSVPSLSYAIMGLAAHNRALPDDSSLESAFDRAVQYNKSAYQFALLLLAARRDECPLWSLFPTGD